MLTLAWDQQLWLAADAFPIACLGASYALWCARTLHQIELPSG